MSSVLKLGTEPQSCWRQGTESDLRTEIAAHSCSLDACVWTWDPRPMLDPVECRRHSSGSGPFPGFAAQGQTASPFLEAHLFWNAGDDAVWEVAVFAGRDDRLRWIWERHAGISKWAEVSQADPKPAHTVRLETYGALVLLPNKT